MTWSITMAVLGFWLWTLAWFHMLGRHRGERRNLREKYLLEVEVERAEDRAFRAELRATAAEDALRLQGGPFR